MLPNPPILVITDRRQCLESLESRAEALFKGGCRWLSLREKDLAADARLDLLLRLTEIASDYGAAIGVHDDIEAALICGCGLHLPAGASPTGARRSLGREVLLGQSCHTAREIDAATSAGVDYVTISPVFESVGKPGYGPALGSSGIIAATAGRETPVLALGGVTLATLPLLEGSGAKGIALMGEPMTVADPQAWFARIIAEWQSLTPEKIYRQ